MKNEIRHFHRFRPTVPLQKYYYRYECNDGYFLNGVEITVCNDGNDGDPEGVWSSDPPTCFQIICPQPRTNPEIGRVQCTDSNNQDSVCT